MLEQMCCSSDSTILQVLKVIDTNTRGIAFAVAEDGRFVGTLTDGDLRRAFISGVSLDTPVSILLGARTSLAMPIGTPVNELIKKISNKIKIIPLLDEQQRVADYFEMKAEFHAPIATTELNGNEMAYVMECISTNWISSQGSFVKQFEDEFSTYIGTRNGVAVSNGTVALHLALVALGVGSGDEVILPDLTFVGTINAVLYTGATPVLVDVEEQSWCIDPSAFERAITPRTKAVIPVHLYGQPCDMGQIMALANVHNISVIEDCAEAHGAEYSGRKVGGFGHINCFSFFGNKIITTGEGGICLTDDENLAEKMRVLRDHGMSKERRYWHDEIGFNYRLTNLQAAIGVAQLERIDEILYKRERIREWYQDGLEKCKVLKMQERLPLRKSVNWLFSCLLQERIDRDELISKAKSKGVDIRPFFFPLHEMPIYSQYGRAEDLPVSKKLSSIGISLPTVLSFSEENYNTIMQIITEVIEEL